MYLDFILVEYLWLRFKVYGEIAQDQIVVKTIMKSVDLVVVRYTPFDTPSSQISLLPAVETRYKLFIKGQNLNISGQSYSFV